MEPPAVKEIKTRRGPALADRMSVFRDAPLAKAAAPVAGVVSTERGHRRLDRALAAHGVTGEGETRPLRLRRPDLITLTPLAPWQPPRKCQARHADRRRPGAQR
jgi:hypothetical protein